MTYTEDKDSPFYIPHFLRRAVVKDAHKKKANTARHDARQEAQGIKRSRTRAKKASATRRQKRSKIRARSNYSLQARFDRVGELLVLLDGRYDVMPPHAWGEKRALDDERADLTRELKRRSQ